MRRGTAVTLAVLSLALATGQSACDKPSEKPATPAEMTPEQKKSADSIAALLKIAAPMLNEHDLSSIAKLTPPPADMQEDTIPLRTPENGPARFGIRSGMLLQKFRGGMTGQRQMTWGAYGMNERRVENYHPVKPIAGVPPEAQNINRFVITTPESFFVVDSATKKAYRTNNMEDDTYMLNDSLKRMSFDEFIRTRLGSPEPRLADTTINGFKLRVYQVNTPNFSLTRWVWRGITMLEHWRGLAGMPGGPTAPDTMEFYAEPVELTLNAEAPAGTFAPPAGFQTVDGAPPSPAPSAPPQRRNPGQPPMPTPGQPPVAPGQGQGPSPQTPPATPATPPGRP